MRWMHTSRTHGATYHKEGIMRRILLISLLVLFSFPILTAQTKCYIVQGKMVCCDNYGMCN